MLLTRLRDAVVDLIYPGACAVCDAPADGAAACCDECMGKLDRLRARPACLCCAAPLMEPGFPCPYCLGKGLRPYRSILSLGPFESPLKDLIHQMKYRGGWPVAEQLADLLYDDPAVRQALAGCDAIVPVPLHPWRQIRRGYNQARVMAKRLSRHVSRPVVGPVLRWRHTPTQTLLHSRQQRRDNLRDAFWLLRPGQVRGRRLLVIDDVLTTGATLQSFGRVLQQGKPADLQAIVLAVADPRHQGFEAI